MGERRMEGQRPGPELSVTGRHALGLSMRYCVQASSSVRQKFGGR